MGYFPRHHGTTITAMAVVRTQPLIILKASLIWTVVVIQDILVAVLIFQHILTRIYPQAMAVTLVRTIGISK